MQFLALAAALLASATSLVQAAPAPSPVAAANATDLTSRALAPVIYSCTKPKTIALTFDDGPWVYMYDVSKAIVAAGGKATFFLNGDNYDCIYDDAQIKRVKYLHDKGHQLGSHTWYHKDLATLTWDQVHDEMWRVEQALQRIIGVQPAFMRPPYGSFNDNVRSAASVRGQKLAIWDTDTEDANGATVAFSKKVMDDALAKKPNNILPLMHETVETTVHQVLPYIIPKIQAAGYQMVTLAECLGEQPYQFTQAPGVKDSSWHC
ncbi:carbohydrate esterase family 4 protein [Flagelloscypha sp. PMI_526]|nr:carbohydrate esterase family 4 protein [Flagelloscypha sp. PMI_526]